MDREASEHAALSRGGPLPPATLYCELLRALRSLASLPALAALLDRDAVTAAAGYGGGGGKLPAMHLCLEALLGQMLSSGIRSMDVGAEELLEQNLWATVQELCVAAPTATTLGLLGLCTSRGTALLVSTDLGHDDRALQ